MTRPDTRWVARLTPAPASSIEVLLGLPLGLDVWERGSDGLVVAASEAQLSEVERRRLAAVDRLSTVDDYVERNGPGPGARPGTEDRGGPS